VSTCGGSIDRRIAPSHQVGIHNPAVRPSSFSADPLYIVNDVLEFARNHDLDFSRLRIAGVRTSVTQVPICNSPRRTAAAMGLDFMPYLPVGTGPVAADSSSRQHRLALLIQSNDRRGVVSIANR
jgi:hypothetical protein